MNEITVTGNGSVRNLRAQTGVSLLDALRSGGVWEIDTPCGGNGTCGKCKVELFHDGAWQTALACQTRVETDLRVRVPEQAAMNYAQVPELGSLALEPGVIMQGSDAALGAAVDIGTTTLAAALYDLRSGKRLALTGEANRQRVYGADVISRIQACTAHGVAPLTDLLRRQIDEMLGGLCRAAHAERADIKKIVAAGNTVMEHLFAGLSPVSIGVAPFTPLSLFGAEYPANALGVTAAENAKLYLAPAAAGYVGGDITAGLLVTDSSRPCLLLDLGTNGEIALCAGGRVLCCAAAAGPAFEGAETAMGMPGTEGAIDHVTRAPGGGVEYTVIGGGAAKGVCGSGLIDALAVLLDMGVIDETGRMLPPDEAPATAGHSLSQRGNEAVYYLSDSVFITAGDIRKLQLAKAAVSAGISVLLEHAGIKPEEIGTVYLAGGFGNYIRPESAARIGLFAPEFLPKVTSPGNTALTGAARILLSVGEHDRAERIAQQCEYIELSCDRRFTDAYLAAMCFGEDTE